VKSVLAVNNLSKHFDGTVALDGFSCAFEAGRITSLIGPNGAGKTTLFNAICGFVEPETGEVYHDSTPICRLKPCKRARLGIGRTFQDLRLIGRMSALENVMLASPRQLGENIAHAILRLPPQRTQERKNRAEAERLLEYVGLAEKRDDLAETLSYGQQKLLTLASCLASGAEVLLLDEPVAGVNPELIPKILDILTDLANKGKTVVFIEHNLEVVTKIAHTVIFMDVGQKVDEGPPERIRNNPRVIEAYIE